MAMNQYELYIGDVTSTARFNSSMFFNGESGIIRRRYDKYQQILDRPKVIDATFLLNELDLYKIDLLIPVYLEQTGHYYAIISITTSNGVSKVKLLQM